jgi:hypothetical protein
LQELIDAYNQQVGNRGWVRARGYFLTALRQEFLNRDVDCSASSAKPGRGWTTASSCTLTE